MKNCVITVAVVGFLCASVFATERNSDPAREVDTILLPLSELYKTGATIYITLSDANTRKEDLADAEWINNSIYCHMAKYYNLADLLRLRSLSNTQKGISYAEFRVRQLARELLNQAPNKDLLRSKHASTTFQSVKNLSEKYLVLLEQGEQLSKALLERFPEESK